VKTAQQDGTKGKRKSFGGLLMGQGILSSNKRFKRMVRVSFFSIDMLMSESCFASKKVYCNSVDQQDSPSIVRFKTRDKNGH
jgi:hypothetical protein